MLNYENYKGMTFIEIVIALSIIAILSAIAIPIYIGYIKSSKESEAKTNLQALRLLEEGYFSDNGAYANSTGTCSAGNDNISAIQALLSGFNPGSSSGLRYSYCIEKNINLAGTSQTPCFRASAFGNTGSGVDGETYRIDCTNAKTPSGW